MKHNKGIFNMKKLLLLLIASLLVMGVGAKQIGPYVGDGSVLTSMTASQVNLGNVTNESKATMFSNPTFTGTVNGVSAADVGLGNVTNESKATMFSTPTFTGTVSGVTKTHVGLSNVPNETRATHLANSAHTGNTTGVTQSMVGLSAVTNQSKATMFTNPTFTGTTKLTVQTNGTSSCTSGGTVCSGTYTPTATGGSCTTGGSRFIAAAAWNWMRVGNVITTWGRATLDCDSGSSILVNLPITSLGANLDLGGMAMSVTESNFSFIGDSTNNVMEMLPPGNPNSKVYDIRVHYKTP